MDTKQKLQLMMDRFSHPNSRFAEQVYYDKDHMREDGTVKKAGTYFFPVRKGDCYHTPKHKQKDCPDIRDIPFTTKYLRQHLIGTKTFAPYQISDESTVKWICFDIDAYDGVDVETIQGIAIALMRQIIKMFGVNHALVEKSGSKGYHVWLFFSLPVVVEKAFALGHMIKNEVQTPENINIEVYPKQRSNKVFGNTVKIPLGIHQKTGDRCLFVNGKFEPHADQWEVLTNVETVDAQWVDENVKVVEPVHKTRTNSDGTRSRYTPQCLAEIMEQGCSEGIRDAAAFRIAAYFNDKDMPEYMAEHAMTAWNKLNNPPLEDEELTTKIASGYSREYSWKPCSDQGFDPFCHSSCAFFQRKVEARWFTPNVSPVGQISRD